MGPKNMLAKFRQFALRSRWHTATVYGLSMSAAVFVVLAGFGNGLEVAVRVALVAFIVTLVGFRIGLIPSWPKGTRRRRMWTGRGGRLHSLAAGFLVGGLVAFAAVDSLPAALVATLSFVLFAGLALYWSLPSGDSR